MKHLFFLQNKEEKIERLNYSNFSSAKEDNGIKFNNDLTFNLMETITKMKNKKCDNKEINKELLLNLTFLLNLCQEENIPLDIQKTGNENKLYSFYFPFKKLAIDNKINFGGLEKLNENVINDDQDMENKSQNYSKDISFDLSHYSSKSNSFYNDNIFEEKNNFEIEFYQCPILSEEKDNSQDYLNLFNQIMEIEEKNNNNDNINEDKQNKNKDNSFNLLNNSTNDNSINYNKNIILTPTKEKSNYNNFINKNLTVPCPINNNYNYFNNNINLFSPKKKKIKNSNFYNLNNNYYQNLVNSMNKIYIELMYNHYLNIIKLCEANENFFINENMKLSFFIVQIKKFILKIGINEQILYQKIMKYLILDKKQISFENFLKCFDLIINSSNETIKEKYNFLFYIPRKSFEQSYYSKKDIQNFFKLISSKKIYDDELTDDIIEKLIKRYYGIYQNDEKDNVQNKLFHIRKLKFVLESFFDDYID